MIIVIICIFAFVGCDNQDNIIEKSENSLDIKSTLQIGNYKYPLVLYDNPSAKVLLEKFPMAITMSELNGNEKYYFADYDLPADAESVKTIRVGDLMLYGSNCIVLFYKEFQTSYSYTKLGFIKDTEGLNDALGSGETQVIFNN